MPRIRTEEPKQGLNAKYVAEMLREIKKNRIIIEQRPEWQATVDGIIPPRIPNPDQLYDPQWKICFVDNNGTISLRIDKGYVYPRNLSSGTFDQPSNLGQEIELPNQAGGDNYVSLEIEWATISESAGALGTVDGTDLGNSYTWGDPAITIVVETTTSNFGWRVGTGGTSIEQVNFATALVMNGVGTLSGPNYLEGGCLTLSNPAVPFDNGDTELHLHMGP